MQIYKYITFSLTFFLFLGLVPLQAQDEDETGSKTWKTLSKITYRKQFDELLGFKIDIPVFSDDVKALEGKEIVVKGYIIPTEGYKSHTEFVFSAFPYNMCFFCGGAGPETVMEVIAKDPIKFTAEAVSIRGVLELNEDDINRLMYILKEVEVL
jgi:hypothetical protein